MRIAIISDTHQLLRTSVLAQTRDCEAILHGGDICSREILDRLSAVAPVYAVRGNNDRDWAEALPVTLCLELAGLRICMAHKRRDLPAALDGFDLAVYGHTHQYSAAWIDGAEPGRRTLLLNPGSCGPRRFRLPVTMALLTGSAEHWTVERLVLSGEEALPAPGADGRDLHRLIEQVIRETDRGQTVRAIAGKYGVDPALTEQIARLYLTHPGVSADGIMTKLGL